MKVLLFYPNFYGMNMLPPAIGLFTSILRQNGHEVALFDTTVYDDIGSESGTTINFDKKKSESLSARPYDDTLLKDGVKKSDPVEDLMSLINNFGPDLIAMSCTEDMYPLGVGILKRLGQNRPRVVLGGVFATSAPKLALEKAENTVDYLLTGEGENTFPEFCRRLEMGEEMDGLEGCWYYKNGSLITNNLPMPVDVNKIPLPDYSLFQESRFYRPMQGKLWRMFPIETHRGCPYTCAYCNTPAMISRYKDEDKRFFRKKSIDNIEQEIKHCIKNYNADSFYFWADTFLAWTNKEFDQFCEMYSAFKLPFWIQTRAETITEYRIEQLKEVGLLRIAFGIEHGNEEFRYKMLHRKIKNDIIIDRLNIVHDLGIPFSVNNIIGFPEENRELAFDTIELNRHIKSDGINAYTFTPFHGTPLRQLAEDTGLVANDELARSLFNPSLLKMKQFPPEEIEGVRRCFTLYVYMPKSRWPDIAKAEKLTPEGDAIWNDLREECLTHYVRYQEELD